MLFQRLIYFFKAINADYVGNYLLSDTDTLPVWEREDIRDELYEIGYNIGGEIKNFYIHR